MTPKEKAIRDVIQQRIDVLDRVMENTLLSPMEKSYYKGKRDGLSQGFDLVGDSLESIQIELER